MAKMTDQNREGAADLNSLMGMDSSLHVELIRCRTAW